MSFWAELKRRNVFKIGVAYVVVSWLIVQVASTVLPTFDAPDWVAPSVTLLLLLGFPLVLVIAWAFEITPEGLKPTRSVPREESITQVTGHRLNYIVTVLLVLAVALMGIDNYVLDRPDSSAIESQAASPPADSPDQAAAALEPPAESSDEAPSTETVLPNSVAVIPFTNMSPNESDAYFAAGIHEEILNQLVKLSRLNVIARTSVMQYAGTQKTIPEIAGELNVETVMEGSVRYADDQVLVTVQLIDADTNLHLWSDSYQRDFANIFSIQADIAMNVANALAAEFTPAEQASIERAPTESLEAYDLYLAAQNLNRSQGFALALETIDEALAIDPGFARAWALKADIHGLRSQGVSGDRYLAEQQAWFEAAQRAAELDPDLVDVQATLANTLVVRRQWAEAEMLFESVDSTTSAYSAVWHGVHLLGVGQFARGSELLGIARRIDPLNQVYRGFHILALSQVGDTQAADEEFEQATGVFGDDWFGNWYVTMARVGVGNDLAPEDVPAFSLPGDASGPDIHNEMRRYLEMPEQGLARLREIHAGTTTPAIGALLATSVWAGYFGDAELAFAAIAEATRRNGQNVLNFWLSSMREVRQLPQFKTFMVEIGIVDYWSQFGWPAFCRPLEGEDFTCS